MMSPSGGFRLSFFEDRYEPIVDGLVIQEDPHFENFAEVPSKFLFKDIVCLYSEES
jgi:hypothetical protein